MGAVKARLNAVCNAIIPNRRKAMRHPVWAGVELSSSHGDSLEAVLCDISTHGCSVTCESDWLRPGGFVTVSLKGKSPVQAIIRWVRDSNAGLEFLRPIPPEQIEWHDLMTANYSF